MTGATYDFIERLRSGHEQAWREFMRRDGRIVFAVARRFHLTDADREELFQNTFLEAFESVSGLRDPSALGSWLYTIAHHSAIKLIQRQGRRDGGPQDPESVLRNAREGGRDALELLERLDEAHRVRRAVSRLPARCRNLVEALYLRQPPGSYSEISNRFGLPIGSIGPTRARCLSKLRSLWSDVSGEGFSGTTGDERVEGARD